MSSLLYNAITYTVWNTLLIFHKCWKTQHEIAKWIPLTPPLVCTLPPQQSRTTGVYFTSMSIFFKPLIFISGSWARPAPDQGNQSREHLEMNRHCSYRYGSNGWKRLTEVSATLKCPIIVSYSYEICSLLLGGRLCKHQRFIGNCFNNYYSGQWH